MWLAEELTEAAQSRVDPFDFFIIAFTIVIAIGVLRSIRAKKKNLLAIGFGAVSLAVFLLMDYVIVQKWLG